jgi:translation initiation factor IF-3
MMHPEIGEKVITRVIDAIKDIAKVESPAKMEGRQMIAVVTPTRAPT